MARKTATAAQPAPKKEAAGEERRPTAEDRFAEFSARYKWYFFVPILLAIVAAIVFGVASAHRKSRERAALAAYRAAHSAEQLDAVASAYPGSFAAGRALVSAGDRLYEQGRYAEARDRYTAYLDTAPDPALAMPVRAAVVQTYIAEHDYPGGIKECNEILATKGRKFVESQAIYYKAYCYELSGDLKTAQVEYQKVGGSGERPAPWSMLARDRLREVNRTLEAQDKKPQKDVDTPAND